MLAIENQVQFDNLDHLDQRILNKSEHEHEHVHKRVKSNCKSLDSQTSFKQKLLSSRSISVHHQQQQQRGYMELTTCPMRCAINVSIRVKIIASEYNSHLLNDDDNDDIFEYFRDRYINIKNGQLSLSTQRNSIYKRVKYSNGKNNDSEIALLNDKLIRLYTLDLNYTRIIETRCDKIVLYSVKTKKTLIMSFNKVDDTDRTLQAIKAHISYRPHYQGIMYVLSDEIKEWVMHSFILKNGQIKYYTNDNKFSNSYSQNSIQCIDLCEYEVQYIDDDSSTATSTRHDTAVLLKHHSAKVNITSTTDNIQISHDSKKICCFKDIHLFQSAKNVNGSSSWVRALQKHINYAKSDSVYTAESDIIK